MRNKTANTPGSALYNSHYDNGTNKYRISMSGAEKSAWKAKTQQSLWSPIY